MSFKLEEIIAPINFAPREWQSAAPSESYGHRAPVGDSPDLARVLALPRRGLELDGTDRAEAIIDMITERYSKGNFACSCAKLDEERHNAEGCIKRLRLVQALALREIGIVGGLLGPIGVGHGKTLIDLLAPLAFTVHAQAAGIPIPENGLLCVLLVPPKLVPQLIADYEYIGEHFHMPSMVIQGNPYTRINPGMPRLQVMPYSIVQLPKSTQWFQVVKPHAIIADECHKLRNRNTATTSRVLRYFEMYPHTRLVAMSGSITSKSIKDYGHLSALALKHGSPLPINYDTLDDLARAVDPSPNPAEAGAWLEGLIATGCCLPGESFYTGIRRRIVETLGVVTTNSPSVDCDLTIDERKAPPIPVKIRDMINDALAFVRPDGEEFVTAMQAVECACQLASGFHYRWIFPYNIFPRDTALVNEWFEIRRAWHKEERSKLLDRVEHLDSPQLCEHAAQRHFGLRPKHKDLPTWASKTYMEWHRIKNQVKPKGDAVRVDDFLVRDAIDWAENHHGMIWYQHSAYGLWLSELSGLPLYGAGDDSKKALLGERGNRAVIASMKAHGTGTNGLQFHFFEQLFINPPADPSAYEQTLGRLHRAGTKFDEVFAWFYMHTAELRKHVKSALRATYYVEGTIGGTQKLRTGFPMDLEGELEDEE